MIVVNLFAGAGAGKSTTASGIFYNLKKQDINCELVTEFAKDLVWNESFKTMEDQLFIFAEQNHRIRRLTNKVDVVITDSPLLLSLVYNRSYTDKLDWLVKDVFDSYNNLNYFLIRPSHFEPIGRIGTLREALQMDYEIKTMLNKELIPYRMYGVEAVDKITEQILREVHKHEKK